MPQQKLNLLQLPTTVVAQFRARPPQIMWCDALQAYSLTTGPDHIPDHILRNAPAPHLSRSGNRAEDSSFRDLGRGDPLIERCFDPFRNRHGSNVPTFADQVHDRPVPLAQLDFVQFQADQFRSTKAAAK